MTEQATLTESRLPGSLPLFEHEVPVRNTFIHFHDDWDDDDDLPSFCQHTLSAPDVLHSGSMTPSTTDGEEEEEEPGVECESTKVSDDKADMAGEVAFEALGSNRALHRSTLIHFYDELDDVDALPSPFPQHTASGPAVIRSRSMTSTGTCEEEEEGPSVECKNARVNADGAEDMDGKKPFETLGSCRGLHGTGACIPCGYFILMNSCRKGSLCDRCHLCTKKDLQRWKRARRTKKQQRKLASEAGGISGKEVMASEAEAAIHVRLESNDGDGDDVCWHQRPFIVKNTFIHSFKNAEPSLPMVSRCKSDPGPFSTLGRERQLELFQVRLSDLLGDSALCFKQHHSMRSVSSITTTSGSCFTAVGDPLDDTYDDKESKDALFVARPAAREEESSLETQGVSLETHLAGRCRACFYFNGMSDGCRKGADCIFCHFCSGKEGRHRKRISEKQKRAFAPSCC